MEELDVDIDIGSTLQGSTCLDVNIGSSSGVIFSNDALMASYSSRVAGPSHGVTLLANAPCQPSTFSVFYYFEMLVISASQHDQGKPADVAIGFSSKENWVHSKLLGTYAPSCGYYPLRENVVYCDKENHSESAIRCSEPYEIESRDYVVGAGFHPCSGNIFFTFCGKVVALWKQSIFKQPQFKGVFPTISLLSYDACVELYFGPSCKRFELEPIPTCLDIASCLSRDMVLSNGNSSFRAIMADQPAPVRSAPFFYFELCIEKENSKAHRADLMALGFSSTNGFCSDKLPGYYKSSCGLILNQGKGRIFCNSMHMQKGFSEDYARIVARTVRSSPARVHDYIGAGIHYGTEEIFFVKNGKFMGAVRNQLKGTLRPVVAFSGHTIRKLKYKGLEYKHWVSKPTQMIFSRNSVLHMQSQEQVICHSSFVSCRSSPSSAPHKYSSLRAEAYRANDVAPLFSSRLEPYYFEVTVVSNVENGIIAIGFSHFKHFNATLLPGCYRFSVGYHGDNSHLQSRQKHCKFGPTFMVGDTIGAGINHSTNTIFFVKNMQIVERIPLHELGSCAVYPVIGLGSRMAAVRVNLGKQPFVFQAS